MGDDADDDEAEETGASTALRTERDKRKQAQQEGGCQLSTKEIEMIFDARQKAESCVIRVIVLYDGMTIPKLQRTLASQSTA